MSARDDLDDLPPEGADAALAAEYVLRLLEPAEHAACARRVADDPAFAALVDRWLRDLAPLNEAYADAPTPAALWARIETRLFGARPSALARLWSSVGLWRGLTVAAAAAALWLAILPPAPAPTGTRLVSLLAPATGATEFLAVYDPSTRALGVNRIAGEAAPGRALELWVIAGEAAAPVSLGVLPEAALAEVGIAAGHVSLIAAGALLAVSDEPAGGSPTGAPTGDVLAAGPLLEI